MKLRSKDFLSVTDISKEEFLEILKTAKEFKSDSECPQTLKGKNIALIFQKPSTRTRVSFEVGVNKLGGKSLVLGWSELQLGRGETVEDTAKVLERYVDAIVARVFSHQDLVKMSKVTNIPIVNSLSDLEHPCQTLADLLTIDEKIGFENVRKMTYVGDGNNNVCHSLMLGCNTLGLPLMVAAPRGYEPKKEIADLLDGSLIQIVNDPVAAVKDADVIYSDVWVSMGSEKEMEERLDAFRSFQINGSLASHAKQNYIFMHCMPAHRGQEVTNDVIDSKNSVVFDQAENRTWTQMALLHHMFVK
ncbi:MAG TPA: ornithine carbamoyltransferase [archaeon]|nr:ornithine carbamoyltransferase [archaeon]